MENELVSVSKQTIVRGRNMGNRNRFFIGRNLPKEIFMGGLEQCLTD